MLEKGKGAQDALLKPRERKEVSFLHILGKYGLLRPIKPRTISPATSLKIKKKKGSGSADTLEPPHPLLQKGAPECATKDLREGGKCHVPKKLLEEERFLGRGNPLTEKLTYAIGELDCRSF